jgi:RNase adaptor protein for sRNA GlmZ degradation
MARLVILTGACGSGKTTIASFFAARHFDLADTVHFDSLGVPTLEEMVRSFGSGEAWQRATTFRWMERLASPLRDGRSVLLEGQIRRSFVEEACRAFHIVDSKQILIDCNDIVRLRRLREVRKQPELANEDMFSWARLLRSEAISSRDMILDTSTVALDESVAAVRSVFLDEAED